MKNIIYKYLLMTGVVLLSLSGAGVANASMVKDYNGSFVEMGTLFDGQHGTITGGGGIDEAAVISQITAKLPAGTMIEFSYTLDGMLLGGMLTSGGSYSFKDDYGKVYEGQTVALSIGPTSYSEGSYDGVASEALAFSSAQLNIGTSSGSAIIKNYSEGFLDIVSVLVGAIAAGGNTYTISYSVSSVPLPAALPMFGMGIIAVAGMRARSKKKHG